jgi:hypothetical protein
MKRIILAIIVMLCLGSVSGGHTNPTPPKGPVISHRPFVRIYVHPPCHRHIYYYRYYRARHH